ncbi:MAG: DUF1206 domain-containing protein [Actinomycetes bacterium]
MPPDAPDRAHVDTAARLGLGGKGVLYLVTGLLAGRVALGDHGADASSRGALDAVAAQPFGRVLLGVLAVGLVAHALWRAAQALWTRFQDDDGAWARVEAGWRALVYGVLAGLATSTLLGAGGGGGQGSTESAMTARVLDLPGGAVLVALVGLAVAAVGVRQWVEVVRGDVAERVEGTAPAVRTLGVVGSSARGVAWLLIGGFVTGAAVQRDADESRGLDGALQSLAEAPAGPWLIGAVALGLLAYGAFQLALVRTGDVDQA